MTRSSFILVAAGALLCSGCGDSRGRGPRDSAAILLDSARGDAGSGFDAGGLDAGGGGLDAGGGGFDAGRSDAGGGFDAGTDAARVDAGTFDAGPPVGGYARSAPTEAMVPFIDACAVPGHMEVLPDTDDSSAPAMLPFAFRYFGVSLPAGSMVNVTSNGYIGMDGASSSSLSGTVPSAGSPNAVIAPHWGDNHTGPAMCIATIGTAPNRSWIVEWPQSYYCCSPGPDLTYEIILHETTGVIDFAYDTMTGGRAQTMGIEDQTGAIGLNACPGGGTCMPVAGQRVRFTPTP